jgi:sulfate adenylyltransferase
VTATSVRAHGGVLVDLVAGRDRAAQLLLGALRWPSWQLTPRQLCDVELLACGGFSPLRGFLGQADYDAVCRSMRLADGTLWPIPVTLDLPDSVLASVGAGGMLALRDPEGVMVAALQVTEAWRPDLEAEALAVFGTVDPTHPGVQHLRQRTNPWYVSGPLEVLQIPEHYDFRTLRRTPAQLRAEFVRRGWNRVVAFNTRNPMHRAHLELTLRAVRQTDANLLIHPVVGLTKPGDVDRFIRVRCYQALLPSYPPGRVMLSLLPLAMRMGGPRETLWHAIIRRNYGATDFIVGRDQVGPGLDASGRPFYRLYEAQELALRHEAELGVRIVPFRQLVYLQDAGTYVEEDQIPPSTRVLSLSGTDLRRRLTAGEELPEWFTPAVVAAELRRGFPPRSGQGLTVFFTGLSGAGKSTIAKALLAKLLERGGRTVTLLDGDIVRQHLSSELGFSRHDRDLNIRSIGFVAAEITKHRGIVLCAAIAPYDLTRREVRRLVQEVGGFVLVHVATPLHVCEERDRKGLYAKARAGLLPQFTGISDPYEEPSDVDLVIDGGNQSPEEAAGRILAYLHERGFLAEAPAPVDGSPPQTG